MEGRGSQPHRTLMRVNAPQPHQREAFQHPHLQDKTPSFPGSTAWGRADSHARHCRGLRAVSQDTASDAP